MDELLARAKEFHGHLGPWVAIGVKMGSYALERLKARKFFGLRICVEGEERPPRSCLIDGLQLSTGCTMGKGNIGLTPASQQKVTFTNVDNGERLSLSLTQNALALAADWKGEGDMKTIEGISQAPEEELFYEI